MQSKHVNMQTNVCAVCLFPRWLQQESVISTASLDSKPGTRRKGLSGSQAQIYASSFDLSNTFARNDYFSDINPRSMRRLMNIVSVTGVCIRVVFCTLLPSCLIIQSISQSVNQSLSQSVRVVFHTLPPSSLIIQSISQSTSQSVNYSVSQSAYSTPFFPPL